MNRKKIGLLGALLFVLVGSGAGVGFFFPDLLSMLTKTRTNDKTEKKNEKLHELDVFVVNLTGQNVRRYVRTSLSLGVDSEKEKEELKQFIAPIRHAVIMLLSTQNAEDISNPDGKKKLRSELLKQINDVIGKTTVQNVYFKEFLIQ